jgi:hypothetical protein
MSRKREIERLAAEIIRQREEPLKARCRDIFYESMREQIDVVNQSRPVALRTAPLADLDRITGNHSLLEVLCPRFK